MSKQMSITAMFGKKAATATAASVTAASSPTATPAALETPLPTLASASLSPTRAALPAAANADSASKPAHPVETPLPAASTVPSAPAVAAGGAAASRVMDDEDDDDDLPIMRRAVSGRPVAAASASASGAPTRAKRARIDSDASSVSSSLSEASEADMGEMAEAQTPGAGAGSKPVPGTKRNNKALQSALDKPVAKAVKAVSAIAAAAEAATLSYHPVKDAPWSVNVSDDGVVTPGPVPFSALAGVFSSLEATTKRLTITSLLANYFRSVIVCAPGDLLASVYLCTNCVAPAFENLELGVGDSLLMKAVSEATGRSLKDVKADADKRGDLGLVAEASRTSQRTLFGKAPAGLSVSAVFAAFRSIAAESGKSSQEKKVATIKRMLVSSTGVEAKYIVRALQGKLRIGLAKQTVLCALAHAAAICPPLVPPAADDTTSSSIEPATAGAGALVAAGEAAPASLSDDGDAAIDMSMVVAAPHLSKLLDTPVDPGKATIITRAAGYVPVYADARRAMSAADGTARCEEAVIALKQIFSELPSWDAIVPTLMAAGIPGVRARCSLSPGIPVTPMLAKPTRGVRDVLTRFDGIEFTCEWKYDGERAQVHFTPDGRVSIFSRNSENTTSKYPDLGVILRDAAAGHGVQSVVLDGEVIAIDRDKDQLLPFQVLSTRARKDVAVDDIKVQVTYAAFDILYLNGRSLLHTPLVDRRKLLHACFTPIPGKFSFATSADSSDVEAINAFLQESVKAGCEGLMVKVLKGAESRYEPSKRSVNWLKLKKDYMDGLTDSLDLVPIAAWRGKGKRTGVFGAYLLACYDPDEEVYQCVTKIGTGFSDEMLQELTNALTTKEGCTVARQPTNVMVSDALADADVWFDPDASEVWEVMAADLSISPVHMAAVGKVDSAKGIALRFPRFLRRRDDKSPADATTADQVATMYREQGTTMPLAGNDDDEWDL